MAEPSEGAYVLINVASQKALDVYWAKNKYQEWVMDNTRHSTWNSQTWVFDKQSDGWQIANFATWKCLDAANSSYWARQVSDNNSTAQRWTVATDGNTATYGGKTYNTYTLKPKNRTSYSLSRDSNGWVKLVNTTANTARWILVPAPVLSDNDTYYIVPESDASKCIEIASGSKSNNAKAQVNSRSNKAYQTFKAVVDQQNGSVKLINVNSNRALDIWKNSKNTPDWVGQYTINNNSGQSAEWSQRWYILKTGTITLNNVKYPTYSLRSVLYDSYGMAVVGTAIKVASYNASSKAQRFAFIPAAFLDNKLTVPGALSKTLYNRSGTGTVTVNNLKFKSTYSNFQMRYKIRTYSTSGGKRAYTDSQWVSVPGGSKVNDGWGPAGKYTFSAKPSSGVVTVPSFSKQFTLNTSTSCAIDLLFEVHAYSTITKNGTTFKSQSGDRKTTVKIRQKPTLSVKSLSMFLSPGEKASGDSLGVRFVLNDSLGEGCDSVKGRLIGADSIPISDWVSSSTMTLDFVSGKTLYRMPNQNEKLKLSYIFVSAKDKMVTTSSLSQTYSYTPAGSTAVSYAKSLDGSYTAIIKAARTAADCCFMEVKFLSGTKMIPCQFHKVENNEIQWLCAPPLNKDVKIWVYSTSSNKVLRGTTTIRYDSHTSIWNWGSSPKAKYTQFATLIVNPDAPPQQKRAFTTDAQFHAPAGRVLPVAFASKALSIDLSVTGVSVDKDAKYVAPAPLPLHNEVEYLILLAELAGKGIHPIYRTPYGDWYQVGISSVDVSKNNIGYSDVSITQRALED